MLIPYEQLPIETLRNIIRENITRVTSDFEGDFENEIDKTLVKIRNKEIHLVFSQSKQDVTLVSDENIKKSQLR